MYLNPHLPSCTPFIKKFKHETKSVGRQPVHRQMTETPENYFRTLDAVRETTGLLLAHPDALQHFTVDFDALSTVTATVLELIRRDYESPSDIPPHSRWRHFEPFVDPAAPTAQGKKKDRVGSLIQEWTAKGIDKKETVKRLLDLFIISVLLDAGAGAQWKYAPPSEPGVSYTRSEGLALASLDWFLSGGFSSDPQANPHQVDASKLESLTVEDLRKALQVSDESNPLVGQERISLLVRLGAVCKAHPVFFGAHNPRPGNLLDFLLQHSSTTKVSDTDIHVQMSTLWQVVVEGIAGVWPATRTKLNGVALGDVWPCQAMSKISSQSPSPSRFNTKETQSFVAFHKLSQWLTYSLMEPLSLLGIHFEGLDKMTGLAEYRNGGLFVDMGVLKLKPGEWTDSSKVPRFHVHDDVIIEWRALTVALLDKVGEEIRKTLGMSLEELPLVKILEAGTWKAGREIAAKLRPDTKGPPIEIISDGTLF